MEQLTTVLFGTPDMFNFIDSPATCAVNVGVTLVLLGADNGVSARMLTTVSLWIMSMLFNI